MEVYALERIRQRREHKYGRLPAEAPLANPYVPFQNEKPPRYEAPKGLIRGTMFPGLDLPFKGMVNEQEKARTPMTELQTLAFAIQELALYLDTHRDDQQAYECYRNYQQQYEQCLQAYQRVHGPMNHTRTSSQENYSWLDDPWPWEYCRNKEV